MGRFSSPDPSGLYYANPADPQSLNLYSYVRKNPLTNTDPTGLDCVYLNNMGTGVDTNPDNSGNLTGIDHNSNSNECGQNGGDWVNGTTSASQIHYNANNDTFSIQSSSTFHNYDTTASAPGPQSDGTFCYGNCDTATGYSSSWKFPSSTFNLGLAANGVFWGGSGTAFAGLIVDSHGHTGAYWGGGLGAGEGDGVVGGVQTGLSNGNSICAMGGAFGTASGTGGAELAATADYFQGVGDGPGGKVRGVGATGGLGGGVGGSMTVTGTNIHPFGAHTCQGGSFK